MDTATLWPWEDTDKSWKDIGDISNSLESGIVSVYAKQFDGVWHYTVVRHWLGSHSIIAQLGGGVMTYGMDD